MDSLGFLAFSFASNKMYSSSCAKFIDQQTGHKIQMVKRPSCKRRGGLAKIGAEALLQTGHMLGYKLRGGLATIDTEATMQSARRPHYKRHGGLTTNGAEAIMQTTQRPCYNRRRGHHANQRIHREEVFTTQLCPASTDAI